MSLTSHIEELKKKHQTLAEAVEAAQRAPSVDDLRITDLKKQKRTGRMFKTKMWLALALVSGVAACGDTIAEQCREESAESRRLRARPPSSPRASCRRC